MSASLELRGVAQRFGDTEALAAIDLAVPAGSYVVLLGPSGSGKTTLLSILGGFLVPTTGAVFIDGADVTAVPPARRPTATVFQDYALFPHLSVAGNIGFGLAMQRVPRGERQRRIGAVLDLVGLAGYVGRRVHALSGGQRQRVALARALAVEPAVLLLDEPLGALDVALRRQVQAELKALQRRVGTTFVHVTHDQEEAMALADLLVVMNGGRIEDQGPPDRVYLRPRTRFTATFLGDSNLIEGRIVDTGEGWVLVETGLGAVRVRGDGQVGAAATLSLRPEQIHAGEGTWVLGEATICDTMFLGSHWRVEVAMPTASRQLTLHLPPARAPRVGERLTLGADPASAAVLAG